MKTHSTDTKLSHPIPKPHTIAKKHHWLHDHWTPFAVIVLTGLISYLAYTLCSHIPVMAPNSSGAWQLFG